MLQRNANKPLETILIIFLVIAGLYFGKPFLVPLCFAGIFALLFVPLSRKLERIGLNRGLASFLCVLLMLVVVAVIIFLITWQIRNLTDDLGNVESRFNEFMFHVKEFISKTFGISMSEQKEMLEKQTDKASGIIAAITTSIMSVVVNFVLVIVYIFLLLYYRRHIKAFIRKLIPKKDDEKTDDAIDSIEKVSQQYLTGMSLMILCLWIMYGIAFSLVGLKNSIFFAMLCGLFELVPYIGNLTGNLLAILMALTQGGGMPMVIGIIITYSLVQFIQTYILEPLVVGSGVNINPLFTILGLVLGELLWGIAGLILAIPLLAMFKIFCDHIPVLKPYGFLIGREKESNTQIVEKIKNLFRKK